MEEFRDIDPRLSEVEMAYRILKIYGKEKNFRDIMRTVCEIKGIPVDNPQMMAAIHTQINLDNRFAFQGKGVWGLKEWAPSKVVRRNISFPPGARIPFRRRTLQDEIEYEETETIENYDNHTLDEEDDWEE